MWLKLSLSRSSGFSSCSVFPLSENTGSIFWNTSSSLMSLSASPKIGNSGGVVCWPTTGKEIRILICCLWWLAKQVSIHFKTSCANEWQTAAFKPQFVDEWSAISSFASGFNHDQLLAELNNSTRCVSHVMDFALQCLKLLEFFVINRNLFLQSSERENERYETLLATKQWYHHKF